MAAALSGHEWAHREQKTNHLRFSASYGYARLCIACCLLVTTTGCAGSQTVHTTAHRLPLAGSPRSAEAAKCYIACRPEAENPEVVVQCMSRCPGYEIVEGGACGAGDAPPKSVCIVKTETDTDKSAARTAGSVTLGAFLIACVAGLAVAAQERQKECEQGGNCQ